MARREDRLNSDWDATVDVLNDFPLPRFLARGVRSRRSKPQPGNCGGNQAYAREHRRGREPQEGFVNTLLCLAANVDERRGGVDKDRCADQRNFDPQKVRVEVCANCKRKCGIRHVVMGDSSRAKPIRLYVCSDT